MSLTKFKKLSLFAIVVAIHFFCMPGFTQEEADETEGETTVATTAEGSTMSFPKSKVKPGRWALGLSTMQWNEPLRIQQGVTEAKDVANFTGLSLSAEKDYYLGRWGWTAGAFIGTGRASGGGNNALIPYQKSKVSYTVFGIQPRGFYRISGRISAGITAYVFTKNIEWPADSGQQNTTSGRNTNAMAMFDIKLKVFRDWELYQGAGPLSEGSTLWKIGVNYLF